MPVVDVDPDELRSLAGIDATDEELIDDLFSLGLEFEGRTDDGALELEFAPDRLDRLSVEGIARSLRYHRGLDGGVTVPDTNDPSWTIVVDDAVPAARPYVTGAVVRGVDLDEDSLGSLLQLQEKLHATMGRSRVKGAVGIHDLTMLKGESLNDRGDKQIRYTGITPAADTFVPLETDAEMTPEAVLSDHPVGQTYAEVVAEYARLPAIYDEIGLFSFPPVINGARTEVTTDSRDLFIELTGTDQWTIDRMLAILCYALDARGAVLESVAVEYDAEAAGESAGSTLARPDMVVRKKTVSHDRIETILGVTLDSEEVLSLLERSGLAGERERVDDTVEYTVSIPPYRVDVRHPIDIIDDVGRAYGFNELDPQYPNVSTIGARQDRSRHEDAVRSTLVGLGFEDTLNFHLTNREATFTRMQLNPAEAPVAGEPRPGTPVGEEVPAAIKEPYSEAYTILRPWILPSLLQVLERNTHRQYPQNLAEVGFVAGVDPTEPTGVAEWRSVGAVCAHNEASYESIRGKLQGLTRAFGVDLETPPTEHPTFIDGRAGAVVLDGTTAGVIGEVHPAVLVEHGLEVPAAAFECSLDGLR